MPSIRCAERSGGRCARLAAPGRPLAARADHRRSPAPTPRRRPGRWPDLVEKHGHEATQGQGKAPCREAAQGQAQAPARPRGAGCGPARAPRAIRRPISRRRSSTMKARMAKRPCRARYTASPAKAARARALKRGWAARSARRASRVVTLGQGEGLVDRQHRLPHRRRERGRVALGADHEVAEALPGGRALRVGEVDGPTVGLVEDVGLHVGADADDGHPGGRVARVSRRGRERRAASRAGSRRGRNRGRSADSRRRPARRARRPRP